MNRPSYSSKSHYSRSVESCRRGILATTAALVRADDQLASFAASGATEARISPTLDSQSSRKGRLDHLLESGKPSIQ
jgi:hypothetical protein